MTDGVAVVSYDCNSLRLLKGCHVEGTYAFGATVRKEQVIKLVDAEAVRANLPFGGRVLAKDLSAELSRGSTLDLGMMLVGRHRTTFKHVRNEKLRGGGACAGATHLIRGAHVGAFAMDVGTRAEVAVTAMIEARSRSSMLATYRDGDLAACRRSTPDDTKAQPGCASILRVELIALGAGPGKQEGRAGRRPRR